MYYLKDIWKNATSLQAAAAKKNSANVKKGPLKALNAFFK